MLNADWVRTRLIGGHLCLDFVNTVSSFGTDHPRDWFDSYGDLLRWSRAAGALATQQASALRRIAARKPQEGEAALERVRAFRAVLRRLFDDWIEGRPPRPEDLVALNTVLAAAPPRRRILSRRGGFDWDLQPGGSDLDSMLWPVAWSAADLLIEGRPERVKKCADETCLWLFFDSSRNRSRRWCSMSDCGNRAKVRRHYHRARKAQRA